MPGKGLYGWHHRPLRCGTFSKTGGFEVIGPGGGGAMYHPTISPHDTQTVLVACDMTGGYITHDGGATWRMFNLRGYDAGFAFDPVRANVVYAVGLGLWRSEDSGRTWRLLWPSPSDVRGVQEGSDHADEQILTAGASGVGSHGSYGAVFGPLTAFVVDPAGSDKLYAASGGKEPALWRSTDDGKTWKRLTTLDGVASHLAVLHGTNEGVWLAGAKGFSVWNDAGIRSLAGPEGAEELSDESIDAASGHVTLLAVRKGRLFVGNGDAKSIAWSGAILPGTGGKITTAAGGHDGRTLYSSFSELSLDGQKFQGIAKSVDAGAHWSLVWKDAGKGAANFRDGWISDALGSDWGGEPLTISVSDKDHALVYATDLGRTMKSTDGGAHWTEVYSHKVSGAGAASSGLDVLTSYGVRFDPFDVRRMFVEYTDIGLFRSEDGGHSWISSAEGAPKRWRNTTYSVVFDRKVRGRMWAAMSGTHDLPRPKMWRNQSPLKYHGGIVSSTDGGRHWAVEGSGMPETAPTHLLLDEASPIDRRVLYAATMGRGVYKSSDGGKTWVAKNSGISQLNPLAFRLAQASDGTLYVVIARRSEDGSIGNDGDGALYRSHDGAESWERIALPDGVNAPNGLAIDPRNPARMYLAAWGRAAGQHGDGGGIFGTTDGGAHWSTLFSGDRHVYDVTLDPKNPSELFAAGFESSAWKSIDKGGHWTRIPGYNFKWGHRVIVDPVHPGWVYINTFGGGVWHGRIDGTPGVEDIATPEISAAQVGH